MARIVPPELSSDWTIYLCIEFMRHFFWCPEGMTIIRADRGEVLRR